MFTNGVENPAARAKQLIEHAKQASVLELLDYVELLKVMEGLIEDMFRFGSPGSSGDIEVGLYLVNELLSSPS
ncbi:hypothetical protein GGF41_008186, partial [Coemansia sp. RSA 2531]